MEYRTIWVDQWVSSDQKVVQCSEVDEQVARWVSSGWTLHSLVPGTNGQTYGGLFITFMRD